MTPRSVLSIVAAYELGPRVAKSVPLVHMLLAIVGRTGSWVTRQVIVTIADMLKLAKVVAAPVCDEIALRSDMAVEAINAARKLRMDISPLLRALLYLSFDLGDGI